MNNTVTLGEIFAKAQDSLTPSFNSVQFESDVDNLSKAETENLLGQIQAEILKDGDYDVLTEMRSIALDHIADLEKAVYADNAQNRKLGRVGQEYGGKGSRGGKEKDENNSMVNSDGYENKSHPKIKRINELNSKMYDTGLSDDEYSEYNKLREELRQQKLKNKNFMKRYKQNEHAKK